MPKENMQLTIGVLLTGTVDSNGNPSISAQYSKTSSTPGSDPEVLNPTTGDINLKKMNKTNDYDNRTNMIFNLSGNITQNGNSINFGFPSNPNDAVTITNQNGKANTQLVPISGANACQLIIDNEDNDQGHYTYCLSIALQAQPQPITVPIDPSIINR
jgi:hypothetical protein